MGLNELMNMVTVFITFCLKYSYSCSVVAKYLQLYGLEPARFLCPQDFPNKNAGVGCHFLHQGIFLTQGINPHLMSPALTGRVFATVPLGKRV